MRDELNNTRLLMITYHFPPDGAIGAVRPFQFARRLAEYGVETWVLTVLPEYAEHIDPSVQLEGIPESRIIRTRVLPSRRDRYLRMTAPLRVWVRRLFHPQKNDSEHRQTVSLSSAVSRRPLLLWKCFTEWLSYPDWYAGWFHPAMEAVEGMMKTVRFSAVYSTSPPRTPSVIALEVASRYCLPWILDLRDPWLLKVSGWQAVDCPVFRYLQRRLFAKCLRKASVVVANTPLLGDDIRTEYPLFAPKVVVLPNGVDDRLLAVSHAGTQESKMVIAHFGSIYGRRTAYPFLQALSTWLNENSVARSRIEVWFYGDIAEDVVGNARRLGIDNVVHVGRRVDRGEVHQLMNRSSVLLLLAQDQPQQIPGKTYEYIATGKPIIAMTEHNSATGKLLKAMPLCYVAESSHDVFQIMDHLWKKYTENDLWCDRSEFVTSFLYSHLAADLAEIVKRVGAENGGD